MRQTGILAAAGIYALKNNIERLAQDHKNATLLAHQLSKIFDIQILNFPPETNIIFFKWTSTILNPSKFYKQCLQNNIRFTQMGNNLFKAVTHLNISTIDIENTIEIVNKIASDAVKTPS